MEERDLRIHQQQHLLNEYTRLRDAGCTRFDFMGGRRSGKTFFILQQLLGFIAYGDVVSVATMTGEQGRLGAYQDAKDIIANSPSYSPFVEVLTTPREIRHVSGGRMFFSSYQVSERAKGIACDWLYINEGNNFTEQQYIDLSASVRKGVFVDRNPNSECWTERNGFAIIHSTWRDNIDNLTAEQRAWFENLKTKAESPNATSTDIALYKMYYLGEYAEVVGNIFTPENLVQSDSLPQGLYSPIAFADPSAMRGADYFAMVLGLTDGERVYIAETFSENTGGYELPTTVLQEWQQKYPGLEIYAETNGLAGVEFYEFARNSGLSVRAWCSRGNKFERIVGEYQMILTRLVWVNTPPTFLSQVYSFDKTCDHDDNIDAANSLLMAYKLRRLI